MVTPNTGPARARQLVEAISTDLGFVEEDVWATLLPAVREKFEYAMRMKDGMISSSVLTLAKNLYTSNARFVFELLQNADDNHFEKAKRLGQVPYVAFKVHPDRIVIECNEDGFTPENLKAICAVGRSSKTGAQGYIGEKGIGFKSVFMAAWKVHIQSGDFSFYFQHRIQDSGFGMIRPLWEEPTEQLQQPLTKITLSLHDQGDEDQLSSQRDTIYQQFNDLQENLLLFMQNLKEIRVTFFDVSGEMKISTTFSTQQMDGNRVTLTRHVTHGGVITITSKIYHLARRRVGNLAKNENRSYSVDEEQTRAYSKAEVVLGFQLTEHSVPIDIPQDVFAFLPMSHMGFKFLIHSDFVTQANRQGIVTTSRRNLGILEGIYDAFIQGILEFCDHPALRYTWMRFLPNPNDHYDHFWSRLVAKLQTNLRLEPVLQPWGEGRLQPITDLRRLLACQLDSHQEPLLRDTDSEIYISNRYQESDLDKLTTYGLQPLPHDTFLDLVEKDLRLKTSRMKSIETDDWHTRVANLLALTFELTQLLSLRTRVRKMPLLPLQDGHWVVSSARDNVYFSESTGIKIPKNTGLDLLVSTAEGNPRRMDLFKHLGVSRAGVDLVRKSIIQKHRLYEPGSGKKLSTFVNQLKFFYLTHHLATNLIDGEKSLHLVTHRNTIHSPLWIEIFLPDDHEFGLKKLFEHADATKTPGGGPQLDFLSYLYFRHSPEKPVSTAESWTDWLCTYAGVRRHLNLVSFVEPRSLSKLVYYVAEYLPDKFLGFLRYHWCNGGREIEKSLAMTAELKRIPVLCQDGSMIALEDAYLPFEDLKDECARYLRGQESFPFLQLPTAPERGIYARDWPFLVSRFGVGIDPDIDFYKQLLLRIRATKAGNVGSADRLISLYSTIYGQYVQLTAMKMNRKSIQNYFAKHSLIFVPPKDFLPAYWAKPCECLWEAPPTFITSRPLKSRFETISTHQQDTRRATERLFRDVLEIPDCSWRDILNELDDASRNCYWPQAIPDLYNYLHLMAGLTEADKETIKASFKTHTLIYAKKRWLKVSECLWSSETKIQGKITLVDEYEDLREFFVDFLGVDTLNLQIVYDELLNLGRSLFSSVEQVKQQLLCLNGLLSSVSSYPKVKPEPLLKANIFPVNIAGSKPLLFTGETSFTIVDRVFLGKYFAGRVNTLDFDLDEVREIAPFLEWLGLDTRYLSRSVREITSVDQTDMRPVAASEEKIRPIAHSLCRQVNNPSAYRIAFHYNSPKLTTTSLEGLYETLRNIRVYETHGISCELHFSQDGKDYKEVSSRNDLHLREEGTQLEIFVPRNKKRRQFCYASKLPARLFEWLMTEPNTQITAGTSEKAHRLVATVLNASRYVVPEILEENGIVSIGIESEDHEEKHDATDDSSESEPESIRDSPTGDNVAEVVTPFANMTSEAASQVNPTPASTPRLTTSEETTYIGARASEAASHSRSAQPISIPQRALGNHPYSDPDVRLSAINEDVTRYQDLLGRVISAARNADFPTRPDAPLDMSALLGALPTDNETESSFDRIEESIRFRSKTQLERDRMVGAAGELYVFELLKTLDPSIPEFSMENWQSTIRDYVKVHAEYSDITRWPGNRETADIVYADTTGALTKVLIDCDYLDASWEHARPNYLLEVKTTTGPCRTPFFMSRMQYQRMREHRGSRETVYVILRVFNLDKGRIGLRVYVDPAEKAANGELVFTGGSWSVTPAA
ncbi:hypothetical protein EDB81DRAFT_662832 [Dactylonectria macrodidyma]|uniref:Protein NO VEIN C-terminal domain-containing protein n=1 Tax=Dactylonectria macrodidyma TaxID=307937 RepID=A0A9P9DYI8_9HYPO|nr:hypothetical protein EDB81DRAFT_662832 [Dactylonectria macrodidyma]